MHSLQGLVYTKVFTIVRKLDICCKICTQNVGCQRKSYPMLFYSIVRGEREAVGVWIVMGVFTFHFVDLQSTITKISSYSYVSIVPCLLR